MLIDQISCQACNITALGGRVQITPRNISRIAVRLKYPPSAMHIIVFIPVSSKKVDDKEL